MAQQDAVNAHERQLEALELRKAGAAYAVIAERLGYRSASGAHAAVSAALKRTQQEPADEVRTLEIERLDRMLLAIWPQVVNGNQGAIDRALRIMERRAKLQGLDAPAKTEHTGKDGAPLFDMPAWIARAEQNRREMEDATDNEPEG